MQELPGVSLMSHIGKLYERILENRLRSHVESTISESQCGFRPGRGTVRRSNCRFEVIPRQKLGTLNWSTYLIPRLGESLWLSTKRQNVDSHRTDRNQQQTSHGHCQEGGGALKVHRRNKILSHQHRCLSGKSILSPLLFLINFDNVMQRIDKIDFKTEIFGYADDVAQLDWK